MTEKYVLREAARPVLTDTVYRRQKHPFLSPPATLNPHDRLHKMVHDSLRGSGLDAVRRSGQGRAAARRARGAPRRGAGRDGSDPDDPAQRVVLGEWFGLAA
jgi:asparagine synthetase B (glutamine-hydrolysing)